MRLAPDTKLITDADVARGMRNLVQDGLWASLVGTLSGGVVLVDLALQLGAGPTMIGLLASVPFFGQIAQAPAVALVDRLRQRRKISVVAITGSRLVILGLALLPLLGQPQPALGFLLAGEVAIAVLGAVAACSWNSWIHDLVPPELLGRFFSRRLFYATAVAVAGGFAAGGLIDIWPAASKMYAYSIAFALAAAAGFVSSWFQAQVPEPPMAEEAGVGGIVQSLSAPLRDENYRRLIVFIAAWNFATNLAAPFFTVYLLQQLGLPLSTVVALWAASQVANALTLHLWGGLSDRLSNKAILAVAAPVYFGSVLALPFAAVPEPHAFTLPILALIHIVMGAAIGGTALATGNIGLKLARHGDATAYMAAISLVGAIAAGTAPILGGLIGGLLASNEATITVHWAGANGGASFMALRLRHLEFLFVLSFAAGLYALHSLTLVQEGSEISERLVIRQFFLETRRTMRSLSSAGGLRLAITFPYGNLLGSRRSNASRERR